MKLCSLSIWAGREAGKIVFELKVACEEEKHRVLEDFLV